jgi:hypothetical protein
MPFGPWPGVPSGGGGGVTEVDVTAPITKAGSVTVPIIGLDFDGISLVNSGGVLERGPLGKDVSTTAGSNAVDVIAIEETSGPTRLSIGAIPDEGPGSAAVLIRAGAGAVITGTPAFNLGLVNSVGVTAPIDNTGSAQNPVIALAFDGISLVNSGGVLERGPLGKDVSTTAGSNAVDVVAIEETSGPSRLAINSIPDAGSGFSSILTRPGGSAIVEGQSNADLGLPLLTVVYHLSSIPASVLFAGGWAFPGTSNSISGALKIEALLPLQGRKTRITANIEANSLSAAAALTLDMTRSGSSTGPNTSITIPPGTTGHFDSGLIVPTTAANDTWGLNVQQPIQLATGSIDGTVTIFVY